MKKKKKGKKKEKHFSLTHKEKANKAINFL